MLDNSDSEQGVGVASVAAVTACGPKTSNGEQVEERLCIRAAWSEEACYAGGQ